MKIFVFVMIGLVAVALFLKATEIAIAVATILVVVLAVKGAISVFKKKSDGRIGFGNARRQRNKDK